VYRNLDVSLLVLTATNSNPSGCDKPVPRPAPDEDTRVKAGFGKSTVHERSHMLGLLMDEYIHDREDIAEFRRSGRPQRLLAVERALLETLRSDPLAAPVAMGPGAVRRRRTGPLTAGRVDVDGGFQTHRARLRRLP
jgi:hypothetical protein